MKKNFMNKNNNFFVEVISYNKAFLEKKVFFKEEEFKLFFKNIKKSKNKNFWINILNAEKNNFTKTVCEEFKVHPLTQEDIKSDMERSKVEEIDNFLFVLLKDFYIEQKNNHNPLKKSKKIVLKESQISFLLKKNYLITFQLSKKNFLELAVRELEKEKSKLRKKNASFLLYFFLDFITDTYYEELEIIGNYIGELEEILLQKEENLLDKIYYLKRNLTKLRNDLWPLRDIIHKLSKNYHYFFDKETLLYFSDTYDHTIVIIELIEEYRDLLSGMIDLYLSKLSNKMNETMTLLTVIGTIFIPLTFITGVYGMNFKNMPILYWKYGYYYVWIIMIIIGVGLLYYFKKKKLF